jgi:transposase
VKSYHPPQREVPDRERAVLFGTRQGESTRQLAARLGVTKRTAERIRARLRSQGRLD